MSLMTAYRRRRSARKPRRPARRQPRLECLEDRNLLTAGPRTIQFGLPTDTPVPADYDGDGRADVAVFRPDVGDWYVRQSRTNTVSVVHWGQPGDVPVPADYDGDGKTDFAVVHNNPDNTRTWRVLRSSDNNSYAQAWGTSAATPVPADYDGDGKADIAVFSAGTKGFWSILQSSNGQTRTVGLTLLGKSALPGDLPVSADYDGDGKTDLAVYNFARSTWSILQSSNGQTRALAWGLRGDQPVPADYDGDRKADIAVARNENNGVTWSLLQSAAGTRVQRFGFGDGTDRLVPADYDGDRRADIAVFHPGDRTWYQLLSGGDPLSPSPTYSIDGTGNNTAHPGWGSTFEDLLRTAPAGYADGVSAPAGPFRPSARLISTIIATDPSDGDTPNDRFLSDMIYAWGQFIDHDLGLTPRGTETFNIVVPPGDPSFDPKGTGTQVIPSTRSQYDPKTGTGTGNPRQQVNALTAWLDGSAVYGSDPVRADALRAHVGGRLLASPGADGVIGTADDLLPFNTTGLPNDNDTHRLPADQLFLAGDVRANENIELTAVQTLWSREHNRLAKRIRDANPQLDDETIFQSARTIVIAEIQSITYNEFLPALLGPGVIAPYAGYNPNVNPGISNEFSTAAFRLGHSLLAPDVEFLNPDGSTKFDPVDLKDAFFAPDLIAKPEGVQRGVDPILKYLVTDNAQEVDNKIVPDLQNFLFGAPGQGGFDLAALNIQRGRDHGLADYNTTRAAYGLPRMTSFSQISSNPVVQAKLQSLYGSVDNIDLWVGGLAEDHARDSGGNPVGSVGPLFQRIIADQFQRLRDGDRLWYERSFSGPDLDALKRTTLAQIIDRNTDNHDLQDNVFFFKTEINGTVFNDANRNGVRDASEAGVASRMVELINASGVVVAHTTTATDGTYHFDNLSSDLKPAVEYRVRVVPLRNTFQTTADPPAVRFTRGQTVTGVDFGNISLIRPKTRVLDSTQASVGASSDLLVAVLPEINPLESLIRPETKQA
jgi:peroxidase